MPADVIRTTNMMTDLRRRRLLASLAASAALPALLSALPLPARAQGDSFTYDLLTERMRLAAQSEPPQPERIDAFLADVDYDGYQLIRFRPDRSRWQDEPVAFRLQAFHLGWLFDQPVHMNELAGGQARPMSFSTADFEYGGALAGQVPPDAEMAGVAGFRLLTPLNRADTFDELVAFLGASYFRALGRGNVYGLSARGLAVNTAMPQGEEFPRFTEFWAEHPEPGADSVTILAALESPSITGAYRFRVTPGETTQIEVTARLFPRADIALMGIAPLTSMFLFGGADPGTFEDFRAAVHDSEYLVVNTEDGDTWVRALNNPPRLGNAFLACTNPLSFGLVQRNRDFDDYLDAQAHYERRPSLMVERIGDWGGGHIQLVEIPSDLEGNDNIVAYWVPEAPVRQGEALEMSYRLHWGIRPPGDASDSLARVLRTRVGHGGVAGAPAQTDRRKFVIDFEGGLLAELSDDEGVSAQVSVARGEVVEAIASRIPDSDVWRLVLEVRGEAQSAVELRATLFGFGRALTETWLNQWVTE